MKINFPEQTEKTGTPISCSCGSPRIETETDVGFDIYDIDEGFVEEKQHRQTCKTCGKSRFVCEAIIMKDGKSEVQWSFGKWSKNCLEF